jgi:hypothetical protein
MAAATAPVTHDERFIVRPTRFGQMFEKSRSWARARLKEWWDEQQVGAPVKVYRHHSGYLYTTLAVIDQYMPRRRDEALERWKAAVDRDVSEAFRRITEIERRSGRRR